MKILYGGETFCSDPTLKRLLTLAEDISFMDRPSVTFKNWGTVGHDSHARRIDSSGSPVRIGAIAPPSGPGRLLYQPFIEADINNPVFAQAVLAGFQASDVFASKFVRPGANYGSSSGREIIAALRADPGLLGNHFDLDVNGRHMFDVSTAELRRETFKMALIEASISVTSTLLVAEANELIPVSDDPYVAQLTALRVTGSSYVGGTSKLAPYVGLAVAKSLLPDELLSQLTIGAVLEYREKAKDAYVAWSTELNRAASSIGRVTGDAVRDEVAKVIANEFAPQVVEYENEMRSIRDEMFAGLIKKVSSWEVPALSLAYLAGLGVAGALSVFASALTPAIPEVVDYFKARRKVARENAMSFLIGLANER